MPDAPHRKFPSARAPLDAPARRRLPPLLRRAWYGLNQAFRRRLAPLDLTPDQFTVLRWLHESPRRGCTQAELAERMASDANTIAALLRRMEEAGLVRRQPHERDARANRVVLDARGRAAYRRARPLALELQQAVLAAIPARQREPFLRNLEALGEAARTHMEPRPQRPPAR